MSSIEENKSDQLINLLKRIILESPELLELIDTRAEMIVSEKQFPDCFTREELAKKFKKSVKSIDRMTDEELLKEGFRRKKIGVSVRFERLQHYSGKKNCL